MLQKPLGAPGAVLLILLCTVGILGSCSRQAAEPGGIVTTIPPLAAILREIAGKELPVTALLPGNASPHTYEPRPSDALAAENALALFYVDPGLDGWATSLPANEKIAVFPMVPEGEVLEFSAEAQVSEGDHHHDHDDGHSHNSHFWSDPLIVQSIVPELVQVLSRLAPARAGEFAANGEAFSRRLQQLHEAVRGELAPARGKSVALFHPSWDYFLKRYGISVAAYIEPSPGKDLSPQHVERLIDRLKDSGTIAIFTEPQLPKRPAEMVAEAVSLPLYELDPLGGSEGRRSYEELITFNTSVLAKALE